MTITIAGLLARNKAVNHTPLPSIAERKLQRGAPPRTVIVTCCDPRCIPEEFLNLKAGEVVVHRNAGGNIRYALRDILILDALVKLDEIAIIHHTDCGTLRFTDEQLRIALKKQINETHWAKIEEMEFGAALGTEENLRGDLEWVHASPLIRDALKDGTHGFIFDLKSGKLDEVEM
ncbi:carbonic anhydrase [Penicillium pulvis]|uniref:carbonic anhydrase n=1 Tax=Penicillium pulvis TaxID=1562058 RepID=UPI002548026C|nr:carbonic anhydrase [Penicillium pulvis]KAJ5784445.1 carbonic anhydrase [Penicillium pulvis]